MTKNIKIRLHFGYYFSILIGLIMSFIFIRLFNDDLVVINNGDKTVGTVIRYASTISDEGNRLYTPVIEYLFNGEKKTYKSNSYSSSKSYKIGEGVPIIYFEGYVVIDSFFGKYFYLLLSLFGIFILLVTLYFFIKKVKRYKDISLLLQQGDKNNVVVTRIGRTGLKINNKPCTYFIVKNSNGKEYRSDTFYAKDIGENIHVGDELALYIDHNNKSNYYIDAGVNI